MTTTRFLDTNVFLRFLLDDHKEHSPASRALLKRVEAGDTKAVTTWLVLAELVWVLTSKTGAYRYPRARVAADVLKLLSLRNLRVQDKGLAREILRGYTETKADFIDAFHGAWAQHHGHVPVFSFDPHFDALGVSRMEPAVRAGDDEVS